MDPIIGGAIISGIAGLASSFGSNKSQRETNATNLKIAQMNNEWSEKMMDKQHLYDVEMWNKNNAYNDPSKQVERLKGAGINPALALGNVGTGQASGGSSVGLPSPSSATMQPMRYEGFANAINNSVQLAMQLDKHQSEMHALGVNTAMNEAMLRAKIAEMYEETRSKKFRNELNDITKDIQIGMQNEQFLKTINERYLVEEQEKLVEQQRIYQRLINDNLPDKLSMELSVMASQRDLNKHNAQHEVGKLIETLKKRGYKLSKAQENAIFEAVISKVENDANQIGSGWQLIGNTISAAKRIKTKTSKD